MTGYDKEAKLPPTSPSHAGHTRHTLRPDLGFLPARDRWGSLGFLGLLYDLPYDSYDRSKKAMKKRAGQGALPPSSERHLLSYPGFSEGMTGYDTYDMRGRRPHPLPLMEAASPRVAGGVGAATEPRQKSL